MNLEKLSQMGSKSRLVRGVYELLASRERSVPRTDLGRLGRELREKYNISATNKEMAELFEVFQKLGLGVYRAGRKPTEPARFTWKVNSIDTFRSVLMEAEGEVLEPKRQPPSTALRKGEKFNLRYPIRGGEYIELILPTDLTRDEAEGLARIITTLGKT